MGRKFSAARQWWGCDAKNRSYTETFIVFRDIAAVQAFKRVWDRIVSSVFGGFPVLFWCAMFAQPSANCAELDRFCDAFPAN